MPFELFHNYFPEMAERETRSVVLTAPQNGLSAGNYGMLEMYCNEPGCDCRRVIFGRTSGVQRRSRGQITSTAFDCGAAVPAAFFPGRRDACTTRN